MGKILKNYIYNLLYQLVVLIVPLVTAPYLARVLRADGTGVYSYVNSVASLICTFVMLGIFNFGNRQIAYVRDDLKKLNDTFWQIMSDRLVITIVGSSIYLICVVIIGKYQIYFLLYYLYILGYFCDCTWLFVGLEDMKWAVIKNIVMKLMAVVGIFLFVKSKNDVGIYIFIQGASIFFANILAYTQLKRYVNRPKLDFTNLKKDLKASFLLFLPSVASTLYLQCDKIMIEMLTGMANQVSYYDYSEKIITIPLSFITVLSTVMMPRIANEYKNGNMNRISLLLVKAGKNSLFLAFPLMFGMICIADKLIPWYLGNDFSPTIMAIYIISPIIITNTLSGISGNQYFTATNQVGILFKAEVIAAIGNIVLNAILIPNYGFIGAAIATLVSSILCAGIQYFYLYRQVELTGLGTAGLKYGLFSILMFFIIRFITKNLGSTPTTNIIQILLGMGIYFGICIITKDDQLMDFLKVLKNKLRRN